MRKKKETSVTVYVLHNTYHADSRVEGVVSSRAIADRFAEGRGNWYDEYVIDGCLTDNLAYLVPAKERQR